jgi:hypothetical protein
MVGMKKALVVAVNDYPGTGSDLQGCINDAFDGLTTLKAKGFTCSSLSNAGAKKATILAALKSLITCARAGDSLVFYYSAHGSRVQDASGDEVDGWDEVLCPHDWPNYVSDDDIRTILATVPAGVNIDVIMDCCHSGTGTREVGQTCTVRALPPIIGEVSHPGEVTRAAVIIPTLNHCLWAGCAANQVSAELSIGGKVRGAFSYYLWKEIRAGGTRAAIMASVCKQVAALGLDQVPQLEASQAEMLQAPFA